MKIQPTKEQLTIDAADTVHHRPTGETWTVACVENDRLSWCGWPKGWAELADCDLVERATETERKKLLERWAQKSNTSDHRHRYAVRRLAQTEPPEETT